MSNYQITGSQGGNFTVREVGGNATGTVTKPTVNEFYFDNDDTVPTSEGDAVRSGSAWVISNQQVTLTGDSSCVAGSVQYSKANLIACGLVEWRPQHSTSEDPTSVTLGYRNGTAVKATYQGGDPTVEGTRGTFKCGQREWHFHQAPLLPGEKSAFIRAKASHDWTERTPHPPKAQHTPNPQYVGANEVLLNRDPALTPYFGRPSARLLPNGKYEEKSPRFTWLRAEWTEAELELRDREGTVTEERGSWGSATVGWTDNVADTSASGRDADSAAVGVKQRLRIQVPNIYTQMTLGEAVSNRDSDGFNYPGFGVQTGGHVFISAGTDAAPAGASAANNFMMLEGKSGLSASSSTGPVFIAGAGGVNVGAVGGVTLAGEQGVMIAGGTGWGAIGNLTKDFGSRCVATADPEPPSWASNQGTLVSLISSVCAGLDVYVGVKGGALQHKRSTALGLTTKEYSGWSAASFSGKTGIIMSTLGAVGGLLGAGGGWGKAGALGAVAAGTTIFGQSGMILASGITMGMYSVGGTAIGTKDSLLLVAVKDINIDADKSLGLSGNIVNILSDDAIGINALKSVNIASKDGSVAVVAQSVSLGAQEAGGVKPTDSIQVNGKAVTITSGADGLVLGSQGTASLKADKKLTMRSQEAAVLAAKGPLSLWSDQKVGIASKQLAGIRVGPMLMYAKPDKVVIGKGPGDPPAAPTPPTPETVPSFPSDAGRKKRNAWSKEKARIERANAKKEAEHAKAMESHAKDVVAMKDASVGLIIKSSSIDFIVSGHRLTLDGSSVKHPSLKILK